MRTQTSVLFACHRLGKISSLFSSQLIISTATLALPVSHVYVYYQFQLTHFLCLSSWQENVERFRFLLFHREDPCLSLYSSSHPPPWLMLCMPWCYLRCRRLPGPLPLSPPMSHKTNTGQRDRLRVLRLHCTGIYSAVEPRGHANLSEAQTCTDWEAMASSACRLRSTQPHLPAAHATSLTELGSLQLPDRSSPTTFQCLLHYIILDRALRFQPPPAHII